MRIGKSVQAVSGSLSGGVSGWWFEAAADKRGSEQVCGTPLPFPPTFTSRLPCTFAVGAPPHGSLVCFASLFPSFFFAPQQVRHSITQTSSSALTDVTSLNSALIELSAQLRQSLGADVMEA